jgi:hypothetical protein
MPRSALPSLLVVYSLSLPSLAAGQDSAPRLLPALSLSIGHASGVGAAFALARDDGRGATDTRPSTGTGLIVTGWILTGIAVLNLATLPVCFADFYPPESKDLCVVLSAVFAGAGTVVGVPLLIVGYNQRADYKAWKKRNGLIGHLLDTRVAFQNDAALLVYRTEI